ncbi:conserved hypothetical protein [Vibrio phage 424E50-1]|nr:conserved hypothetical protein [Vibrio phage 424E50-1]
MTMYVETTKPESLSQAEQTLYYMYANGIDTYNKLPIYREITTETELEVVYKVYYKLQDDVNKL